MLRGTSEVSQKFVYQNWLLRPQNKIKISILFAHFENGRSCELCKRINNSGH